MFDNPHNLCFSNFNGRRLRTPKRLFPEIAVNYDGFPSCAKCGNVEQDHNGLQNGLCLECRKGEVCISVSHVASPSSMGQSVSMERSIASTNSPSSPPESDSPESAGWVLKEKYGNYWKSVWQKNNGRDLICEVNDGIGEPHAFYGYRDNCGVTTDGISNSHAGDPFPRWQDLNAILFPGKREFRVGDLVECLPDGDAESSKLRAPRRNW